MNWNHCGYPERHPGKYGINFNTLRMNKVFWKNKKVFITGHTGFKGSWLCLYLNYLGAKVTGYALPPPTSPALFNLLQLNKAVVSVIGDIRDSKKLKRTLLKADPDIVIHMAAQPLVRDSYQLPVETYEINVLGTIHLLEAIRSSKKVRAVVNVTTDKCYENKEHQLPFKETDALGGYDPYSNSKACSELVTATYRNSFFNPGDYAKHKIAIATARAGNVIGGGDWSRDRIMADCVRAIHSKKKLVIRHPDAIRPWQHVLEPISGYLLLAENLYLEGGRYGSGWNFGPESADEKPVEWLVKKLYEKLGIRNNYKIERDKTWHEATYLKLDCSKAKQELHWAPKWNLEKALDAVAEWTIAYLHNEDVKKVCLKQINEYFKKENDETR
jgi:CDP-glucose 4,6-dehydratase